MNKFNFKTVKNSVTFFAVTLSVIVTLYHFIPQVLSSFSPINEAQVERLLREHKSFVGDGNVEGMLSVYHPEFSMEVIHSTGFKESFDKSQIVKHQEYLKRLASVSVEEKGRQISVLNSDQALVSILMQQNLSIKDQLISSEKLYQTMLVVKHGDGPRILKVLSMAVKT